MSPEVVPPQQRIPPRADGAEGLRSDADFDRGGMLELIDAMVAGEADAPAVLRHAEGSVFGARPLLVSTANTLAPVGQLRER